MDAADIVNDLWEFGRKKTHVQLNESTSIGMMQHLGLKMGAARKEHTHVNMRSDVNHRQSPQDWIYYGGYPSTN